jgi:hypothetical protein
MIKPLKITQNHAKLSQEHSKKLTNPLFLDIPNGFSFLDQAIWRMQKKGKQHQIKEVYL